MSNEQKTPLSRTLNQFARDKALAEIRKRGQSLPGRVEAVSGQIVAVNFAISGATLPLVRMPLATSEYVRLPIQTGDLGSAFAMDASIALISGLGTTPAVLDLLQGNLSTLVWVPVANANWSTVDPDALTLYGPNGVVTRDKGGASTDTLTPTNRTVDITNGSYSLTASDTITFTVGSHSIVISSSGVTIDGKVFLTHAHTGVTTGSSDTGVVA